MHQREKKSNNCVEMIEVALENFISDTYTMAVKIIHPPIENGIAFHQSDNKTELLPGFLPLVPNMPVLLTDNIACELGLSNGTQGIFRELVYDEQEDPVTFNVSNAVFPSNTIYVRKPLCALMEINFSHVETSLDGLQPKLIPISLVKKEFSISIKQLLGPLLEQRSGRKAPDMIYVTRTQLPIVPAFAITTYKAQGLTMGKIVVDLQLPPTASQVASIYVPLNRVKRAEDLAILRPFDMKVLQIRPSSTQNAELARLDELDRKTQRECAHFTFKKFVHKYFVKSPKISFLRERAKRVRRRALLVYISSSNTQTTNEEKAR